MATIVFNAVGSYLGGPIGGAIGSLIGRQVDTALFGSSSRQGPRLAELAVSTSSYGQILPRHFGRMRVAGSILWATDLVEHSETTGGGKGAPSATTYSYTVSLAVALSSRPIQSIGRIWADGKLLRGEAGDLKVGGTLRVYTGVGDQEPDPLILAAEGESRCPAHRDLAYVVFEDLDLSDYYNRIPALTFEVVAEEEITLQNVIGEVIEEADANVPLPELRGLTCDGPLAGSLEILGRVLPLEADAGAEKLIISRERLQTGTVMVDEAAASVEDDAFGPTSGMARHRSKPPEQLPKVLRYYDPERDYLPGSQRPVGRMTAGEPQTIDLPAAIDAASARKLIENNARRIDWARERIAWRTCTLDSAASPGAIVSLPGLPGRWRVLEWEWHVSGVELSLARVPPGESATALQLPADSGRASLASDMSIGTTALVAFELPLDGMEANADTPRAFAAVSSASANWRGAALYADRGDGELHPLGPSNRGRSVIGTVSNALPAASPLLVDRQSQIIVSLVDPAMQLASVDMRQLAFGANLALVGEEILQFAKATPVGDGNWRLEGLLRGRGGTEGKAASHVAGEPFVVLNSAPTALDVGILGRQSERQLVAIGRGDDSPVVAPVLLDGITLRPLAPVHPRCSQAPDGTLSLGWTRRARGGWQWQDGVDVPLVEEAETYIVTLGAFESPFAQWNTHEPRMEIPPAVLITLLPEATGQPLTVRQRGTHALSDPLHLCILT
ncbi:MAG: phage tail protein [Novosphingobium sp.]